jgi:hypothetical protein
MASGLHEAMGNVFFGLRENIVRSDMGALPIIAYFSLEIAPSADISRRMAGLGIWAGDTL